MIVYDTDIFKMFFNDFICVNQPAISWNIFIFSQAQGNSTDRSE